MSDPGLVRALYGPGSVMCQICFEIAHKTDPRWAKSSDSGIWDLCDGDCATQAGLVKGDDGVWRDKEETEMPKKKPDETPADAVMLDADHLPPIGSIITAYDTPWNTVIGEVVNHQEKGSAGHLGPDHDGVTIKCTSATNLGDQRFVGERLLLKYGSKYKFRG